MGGDNEDRIRASWTTNAAPWTAAIRAGTIKSRVEVTNDAVEQAVLGLTPSRVLDLGCGEGWLARSLAGHGIDVVGVDAEAALIDVANERGGGDFRHLTYDQVTADAVGGRFDAVVANFSLLGEESVSAVIETVPTLLTERGSLVVQTLHPHAACGDAPYQDGWREGSWDGFADDFSDPAPWYFRTLESWIRLLLDSGLTLDGLQEPLDPSSGKPASVLLTAIRQR